MAGVSKGQFSNDDFIYVSRWTTFRRIREGGGFAFNSRTPNARPIFSRKNKFDFISQTQKFFCPTRAEQVFVNTSERNVRVCVYMCI